MPTPIKRIVIFGDSVSDIGNMKARNLSMLPMVKLNEFGRFSDGRNWVDFFWESLGGTMFFGSDKSKTLHESKQHLSLATAKAGGGKNKLELVNYAEGGAVGLHESTGQTWGGYFTSSLLSTLKGQVTNYWKERGGKASPFLDKQTLFIIWIGANDVVTVHRAPEAMPEVANYVFKTARSLLDEVIGSHVVIVGLPDPQYMPRFSPKGEGDTRKRISTGATYFNKCLSLLVNADAQFDYLPNRSTLEFFDIGQTLEPKYLAKKGFAPFAQPSGFKKGDKVGSLIMTAPLLQYTDTALEEDFDFGSVSDLLHPTEGVYEVISDVMSKYLTTSCQFTFGA